jgi:hypothetical protein
MEPELLAGLKGPELILEEARVSSEIERMLDDLAEKIKWREKIREIIERRRA